MNTQVCLFCVECKKQRSTKVPNVQESFRGSAAVCSTLNDPLLYMYSLVLFVLHLIDCGG